MNVAAIREFGYWGPSKPWRPLPLHTNRGVEIVLVTKGEFTWQVESHREPIRPGTIFFTLPHQRHGAGDQPHAGLELYYVVFNPAGVGLGPVELRWVHQTLQRAQRHAFPATPLLRTLLPAVVRELTGSARGRDALATGLLRALLVELTRLIAANPRPALVRADPAAALRRLLRELDTRYAECWTLDQMAAVCGLKRTQFAKRFSELTGDSPMTYLNRVRIRRAQHLLRTTDQTVTAIALACGFQSSQYFATVFRQFTGTAPSATPSRK